MVDSFFFNQSCLHVILQRNTVHQSWCIQKSIDRAWNYFHMLAIKFLATVNKLKNHPSGGAALWTCTSWTSSVIVGLLRFLSAILLAQVRGESEGRRQGMGLVCRILAPLNPPYLPILLPISSLPRNSSTAHHSPFCPVPATLLPLPTYLHHWREPLQYHL